MAHNLEILYKHQAIKQIKLLDVTDKQRIKTGIENLPLGDIKKLKGYTNSYRLRVGNYRVLFNLNDNTLEIVAVLPRGGAYKNL